MSLTMYSSKATQLISTLLSSAYTFMSSVIVPGTNISFFTLFGTLLLGTVFISLFRRFLGMDFNIRTSSKIRDEIKASKSSNKKG